MMPRPPTNASVRVGVGTKFSLSQFRLIVDSWSGSTISPVIPLDPRHVRSATDS